MVTYLGGVPNIEAAAKSILSDWNRYYKNKRKNIKNPFLNKIF